MGTNLKGLLHEDFAVLGQFFPYTKRSCKTKRKLSNLKNRLFFWWGDVIFGGRAPTKNWPNFVKFQSISDDRKQFKCRNIVFNRVNITRPLFVRRHFLAFLTA